MYQWPKCLHGMDIYYCLVTLLVAVLAGIYSVCLCLLNFALLLWSFWFYCHKARARKQTHKRRQKLDAQYVEIKRTVSLPISFSLSFSSEHLVYSTELCWQNLLS
jgi:hypothetical protein